MSSETSQLFAVTQIDQRNLRTLTTRFDTRAGVISHHRCRHASGHPSRRRGTAS